MRRMLKALFLVSSLLALLGLGVGGYWYWSSGGPGGMARDAGQATMQGLARWGREHPELAASLRRHLAEAAGRPEADLTDLHLGIDDWLAENADELADLQGLTLSEDQDELIKVLELRRGLTRKLTGGGTPEARAGATTTARDHGTLEISGGDGGGELVGEAHVEPGLELVPGEPQP